MSDSNSNIEKEYKRWKDYANVLLIALTVLFAGLGGRVSGFSSFPGTCATLSAICGAIGIVIVVIWHAREHKVNPLDVRPPALFAASCFLGAEVTFLAASFSFS